MTRDAPYSHLTHLACGRCGAEHDADALQNVCTKCGKPLLARYDIEAAKEHVTRTTFEGGTRSMWRFHAMMPVRDPRFITSLGEGITPLLDLPRLGRSLGLRNLSAKEESLNPTGSFKARGLGAAVSANHERGATAFAVPSAGNAAAALSAFAARAGIPAHVAMPKDVPAGILAECRAFGADVDLVDGLITDAAARIQEGVRAHGWFDVSTLKEPYRVEGKKTMGYELAVDFDWSLPDVIIYPTGGGTGIVGMWKAFDELESLGLIGGERPRMVSVQSDTCAPIVRAFEAGVEDAVPFENARTAAHGLRVPKAIGDFLILRAIRASGGTAVAVTDDAILEAMARFGRTEGLYSSPESAATLAALDRLVEDGAVAASDRVVLFHTGGQAVYA